MVYYKLIKWVQLSPYQKRQYILPITSLEDRKYLKGKNVLSNTFIPVSKIKYYLLRLLYKSDIKQYWEDQKTL